MFGYVKPVAGELLVREHEFYRATYCGICRAMKRHTGALSNITLSYDSVFLALVRMLYIDDADFGTEMKRCIAHPAKKRPMLKENPAVEYTAKAFAILAYYKAMDDLTDESVGKRLAVSAVRPIVAHGNRIAGLPELSRLVGEGLAKISELEKKRWQSVDEPAALFGEILGGIFAYGLPEGERLVPYECGYHLGKFIYAADAAEDYYKDIKRGSYNPYAECYGKKQLTKEDLATIKCGLILECKRIEGAMNLLPYGNRATIENILNNIIYLGLIKRIDFLDKEPSTDNSQKET